MDDGFCSSRLLLVFVFLLILTNGSLGWSDDEQTRQFCHSIGGEIVDGMICPANGDFWHGIRCQISADPLVFFNGCSSGVSPYGEVFFSACVNHDLCYHHEPASTGMSRKDCDEEFLENMRNICQMEEENGKGCHWAALAYYGFVRLGGQSSFECSNIPIDRNDLFQSFFYL